MKFRLLIFWLLILIISPDLLAQNQEDTIRNNENFRQETSSIITKKSYRYIGLQANQLLRQLLGSAGSADNPYIFAYSYNSKATGSGMNFGFGFDLQNTEDSNPSSGINRDTKSSSTALRVGYDFKKSIGKRWVAGFGIDAFRTGSKSETKTTFTGGGQNTNTFKSRTNGIGLGPRLQLLFNISEKIYLGTEATIYFMNEKTTSNGDPNIPSSLEQEIKEKSFKLGVPSALFILIRF